MGLGTSLAFSSQVESEFPMAWFGLSSAHRADLWVTYAAPLFTPVALSVLPVTWWGVVALFVPSAHGSRMAWRGSLGAACLLNREFFHRLVVMVEDQI